MTNFKKYALAAAIVIPTIFTASNKSEASVAVKDANKAKGVNVRDNAGLDSNIIGGINDSTAFNVIEDNNGWLKIEFNGKEGFVAGYLFNVTDQAEVLNPANFRKSDDLNSEIYSVLQKGNVVEVIAIADNGFVKVSFDGTEGYVHHTLLNIPQELINQSVRNTRENKEENNNSKENNNTKQATQTQQAKAQTYQAPKQTYQQPAQTQQVQQAPAKSYTANNSSAKQIIAQRESGGSYNARNGQYIGKYQLSSSYLNGDYSPANQERVADQYVAQRYGSWDNALAFWNNNGWY